MSESYDIDERRVEEIAEPRPLHVHSVVNGIDGSTKYVLVGSEDRFEPEGDWIVAASDAFVEVEQ